MPFIIGLIFLAVGISLTVIFWSPAFLAALGVLVVGSFFFWGLILSIVGYSEIKSRREFNESISPEAETDAKPSEVKATETKSTETSPTKVS
jgi:hypothetical protein